MAKRVLMLHTGGTLGMTGSPLEPGRAAARLLDDVPELRQLADVHTEVLFQLDSSDVGPTEWSTMARRIGERAASVDGIVLIHGTDTLAFTAAALTFALPGLDRPVVLTGAQRPLAAIRSDARRNLVDAVEVATCGPPEVLVCFDGQLLRGCRATKLDAEHYRAFGSPGVEPLGRLGVEVDLRRSAARAPSGPFLVLPDFDSRVATVWATPGLRPEALTALADAGAKGIVLAAFGVGNLPLRDGLVDAVAQVVGRGVDVLVVSQAGGRIDLGLYRNGRALREAGAIAGGRMRVEAAVPKMMHALAHISDATTRRAWLGRDVAGEFA